MPIDFDFAKVSLWVRRARRGDEEAFRALLESHSRVIASTLFACGIRDAATAEDLSQEVSLRVWQALDGLKEPRAFPAWLRRIVANTTKDYHRAARPAPADLEQARDVPSGDSPHRDLVRRRDLERRVKAFQDLDEESKALLIARAEGRQATDLAAELGLTPEAVRMRLMRARQRLRARVQDLEEG